MTCQTKTPLIIYHKQNEFLLSSGTAWYVLIRLIDGYFDLIIIIQSKEELSHTLHIYTKTQRESHFIYSSDLVYKSDHFSLLSLQLRTPYDIGAQSLTVKLFQLPLDQLFISKL